MSLRTIANSRLIDGEKLDNAPSDINAELALKADATDLLLKANLESPNFTGTPTAPTATTGTNTTQIATTEFVTSAVIGAGGDHNSLIGLQGGTSGQYYHLTADKHDATAGTGGTPSSSNKYVTEDGLPVYLSTYTGGFGTLSGLSVNGNVSVSGITVNINNTLISTEGLEINSTGSGNRNCYVDFIADDTYTDYGLRIGRGNTGANAVSNFEHRGTGGVNFTASEGTTYQFQNGAVELDDSANMGSTDASLTTKKYVDDNYLTSAEIDTKLASYTGTFGTLSGLSVSGTTTLPSGTTMGDTEINSVTIEVNKNGSGNRYAIIYLVGDDTYTDYGSRFIRENTGANARTVIDHRGTGNVLFNAAEGATFEFNNGPVVLNDSANMGSTDASLATKKYVDDNDVNTFLGLTDTPSSFSGQGGKQVLVNTGGTSLEFAPKTPFSGSNFYLNSFNRSTATGTGNQVITGVGFTPLFIEIYFVYEADSNEYVRGNGMANSTTNEYSNNIWVDGDGNSAFVNIDSKIISAPNGTSNYWSGEVSAIGSDGFTIAFTMTGTPNSSFSCYYKCIG